MCVIMLNSRMFQKLTYLSQKNISKNWGFGFNRWPFQSKTIKTYDVRTHETFFSLRNVHWVAGSMVTTDFLVVGSTLLQPSNFGCALPKKICIEPTVWGRQIDFEPHFDAGIDKQRVTPKISRPINGDFTSLWRSTFDAVGVSIFCQTTSFGCLNDIPLSCLKPKWPPSWLFRLPLNGSKPNIQREKKYIFCIPYGKKDKNQNVLKGSEMIKGEDCEFDIGTWNQPENEAPKSWLTWRKGSRRNHLQSFTIIYNHLHFWYVLIFTHLHVHVFVNLYSCVLSSYVHICEGMLICF